MNFRKLMAALALAFVFSVSCVRAQDQQPQQAPDNSAPDAPLPPAPPDDTGIGTNTPPAAAAGISGGGLNSDVSDTTIQPDSAPLGGVEASGIVSPTGQANVLDPALHASVGPDTEVSPGGTNTDVTLGGSLAFDHFWTRNEFSTAYSGGANLYTPASNDNSQYHLLSVLDVTKHQRVTLLFRDDFSDSAGSVFGGLNIGGPALTVPTGFINSLMPTFAIDQTILTSNANRIANASLGEFDYALSRRATLTFAGSYELLHFLTAGYINSSFEDAHVAYSYQVNRRNSIAFIYDYNYTTYSAATGALVSQTPQIAYGLKLRGRLAFQVSGGPQFLSFQNVGASNSTQWSWNVASSLNYRTRRTSYSVAYSRGVNNGSGVLFGALSDTITGAVQTTLSRRWSASATVGYSDNGALSIDSPISSGYGDWYATVSLGRLWGRTLHTIASYGLQEQTSGATCPVANCGPSALRQVFTITIDWHLVPINLQQ